MNTVLKPEEFYLNPAMELKQSIQSNTLKGFISTMLLISLISFGVINLLKNGIDRIPDIPIFDAGRTIITYIDPGPDISIQSDNVKTKSKGGNMLYNGIDEIAGAVKAVSDETPASELGEFATIDKIGIALSAKGDGIRKFDFNQGIIHKPVETVNLPVETKEEDEVVLAEIYPACNMWELSKNIKYPEIARKIGLEGRVTVQVLIDASGAILKTSIIQTDNEVFNNSALEAIRKTTFTPAVQNGMNVKCPVVIPIVFKLK